jgi:hypothetical protein
MDTRLQKRRRVALESVLDLLRVGRLRADYVAISAALGHEEALRSGIPAHSDPRWSHWPACDLTNTLDEGTWRQLAADVAEHAVHEYAPELGERFQALVDLARAQAGEPQARPGLLALRRDLRAESLGMPVGSAERAVAGAVLALSSERASGHNGAAVNACLNARSAAGRWSAFEKHAMSREVAWQRRHLARCLISPRWPDWRETQRSPL